MYSPCIKQTVCKVLKIFQHGKYLVAYVLKIGKNKLRSCVDTGAEVSLLVQRKLQFKTLRIDLYDVSGEALKIDGCINLKFTIRGTEMQHLLCKSQTKSRSSS